MSQTNSPSVGTLFSEFYAARYSDEIHDLEEESFDPPHSLSIDWTVLDEFDADLAADYLKQPDQLQRVAEETLAHRDGIESEPEQFHVRLFNIPTQTRISELRSQQLNSLVSVYGTITGVSELVSKPLEVGWECQLCGQLTRVPQAADARSLDEATEPHECLGCERTGPFQASHTETIFQDSQSIVVREPIHGIETDDSRSSIHVDLHADLTGTVEVGDHVCATGELALVDSDRSIGGTLPDKYINAHSLAQSRASEHIELTANEKRQIAELTQRETLYEDLQNSIAPTIEGHETEKLALLLQLFSGVRKELPDGRQIRGDIHVLFVGDPATSKSVLAKQAARLAPRATFVNGSDTSAAGLTSAATVSSQSHGKSPWTIEGRTIAMANEGLAVIDNFYQLRSEAQTALHGVLEHQEINTSKATEKRSIPAQTSVLATANPKYGRYDPYEPLADQLEFPPQLISEFDLLFLSHDQPDEREDARVADRVLETQYAGEVAASNAHSAQGESESPIGERALAAITPPVDHDLLRKYIAYAHQNCYPRMTDEARKTIRDFYVDLRANGTDEDDPVPVTARKLEALVRLSEASARVRLSDTVEKRDAERVVEIVRSCLQDMGVIDEPGEFDADIVKAGTAKSQRDRIENVKALISDIAEEYDRGAPVEVVLERGDEIGMDESKVEHEIDKLKQKGEVYEPSRDILRTN